MPAETRIIPIVWTVIASLALVPSPSFAALQAAKKAEQSTGSVSGTVTCADTNAPARFAVVALQRDPDGAPLTDVGRSSDYKIGDTATTDLEGRFVLENIPAGQYYVLGSLSGCQNAQSRFDRKELAKPSEALRKSWPAPFPT